MAAPAAMQKGNGQQQRTIPYYTPETFLRDVTLRSYSLITGQAVVENQPIKIPLPQAGLATQLWIKLTGTITVAGTVTGGTWANYPGPAPFGFFKGFQFGSNQNFIMRQQSGWGLTAMYNRARYGYDTQTKGQGEKYIANNVAAFQPSTSPVITPGANIATGTFTFTQMIPVPLTYNRMCDTSLLVLQSNSTIFTAQLDFGTMAGTIGATGGTSDMITGLTGSGLSVTASATVSATLDYYDIPGKQENLQVTIMRLAPLIGQFISVGEFVQTLQAGTNTIKLPQQDIYSMIGLQVVNSNAPVAVANIANLKLMYAGNNIAFQEDYSANLERYYFTHDGHFPMDGTIWFDLALTRDGVYRRDRIGLFNNQAVTNAQIQFDVPQSLSLSGGYVLFVGESLRSLQQPTVAIG